MPNTRMHQFTLEPLFRGLSNLFDGDLDIEKTASAELAKKAAGAMGESSARPLAPEFLAVMGQKAAHPICVEIAKLPFNWAPPQTSQSDLYKSHSHFKAHVELLGPDGLVKSDVVRLGLYGMMPQSEYGIRTHPAEEIYIMLAGQCYWMRGTASYQAASVGQRSYHPSDMPHATLTKTVAFMSVYAWAGDLSTDRYSYQGLPG